MFKLNFWLSLMAAGILIISYTGAAEGAEDSKSQNQPVDEAQEQEQWQNQNRNQSQDPSGEEPRDVMTIKTIKTKKPEKVAFIQLVSPPNKSTLSNGVVTFEWEFKKEFKKKKLELILENTESGKQSKFKAKNNKFQHYMNEGQYKWQVQDNTNKNKSKWYMFKVINIEERVPTSYESKSPLEE
jgi:hypothetical protein